VGVLLADAMPIEIRSHRPGGDLDPFIRAAHEVFRGDPAWVPPLELEIRDRLTPEKNPFFEHGDAMLFTAHRNGRVVGRCSASVDRRHLEIHQDDAGFFGFFDTIDDAEVAEGLLTAAERWLRLQGVKRMRGPISLNINEETGCLVEGFEHPPALMMPHSRCHQGALIEGRGLTKCKDLFAWRYEVGTTHKRADRAWNAIAAMPEVRFRSADKSRMEQELGIVMDIFNEAWQGNWGFVPATENEVKKTATDMKLIIDENLAFFAEIEERPVGMCICLPNVNEVIGDLGGKLFPFGFARLLWRTKVKHPRSGRLLMLGLRPELRGVKRYGGLSLAMYVELSKRGLASGYEWAELSWTLEDNHPVNLGIRAMGGTLYKRYRIYEKELPS